MARNRALWQLAGLLVLSLVVTACGAAGSGTGQRPVRIASVLSGQAGYLTALIQDLELDRKHDIDVQVMDLGLVESANALRQSRADVAIMSPSAIARLRAEQSFESVVVGPFNWSGNAWVVRENAPYRSFADLRGERIGNFPRTAGAYFFSSVLANHHELDIEDDFESVEADVSALVALLEKGEVEAVNIFEPHVSKLVTTGDYRVLVDFDRSFQDVMGSKPLKSVYAAQAAWVEKNPKQVDAVQRMFADALAAVQSGKDRTFFEENAEELFGLTTQQQIDAGYQRNQETLIDPADWGGKDIQTQNAILTKGVEIGLLPKPPAGWEKEMWLDCYHECENR